MSKHRTRTTRWSRLLSGVLCLALVLGLLPAAGLIQTAEAHWADPYGEQLVEWGVMTPASDLRLSSTITRAEFVAMCNRAFGYDKLGGTPFTDVPYSKWYAQDIDIAYNAGYFQGTSTTTASPEGTLTREQAAVLVARNFMLQETVGESLGFTDSRDLSEWSRGLIGAAVAEGMISGYDDGSYRPFNNITRGEVAAMLVRVIGTPINKEGTYAMGSVYGNVTISSSNVTLRNTVIAGNLYVTGGVDLGNVLLENVTVLGRIVVSGGGESNSAQSSVVLRNVVADELLVDSMIDQFVTISAYGANDIPVTHVRSNAYLDDSSWEGYGLQYIELDGEPGTELHLAGNIKEVVNKTPFSVLELAQGTAEKITIDEYATDSQLIIYEGAVVYELNLDVATLVTGKGDIKNLNIYAADCEVDILPENVTIRPDLTASVGGEEIGSIEAAELSSEPRLLAGYPKVLNIAPTEAEAQFSVNKAGTIYYAISEMADGSVDEDDLINNPVYGGKIFEKQAGSIGAASKNVYSRQITKLAPDGQYYISAVMVDGRGMHSPVKVASFTTPDNTKPAFVVIPKDPDGKYPYMSKISCDIAQATVMANKSCQLYYALVAEGAAAPTPQEFKSGSVSGNYGYGTQSVTKNVQIALKVNRYRLQEKTTYWLYLWLTDFNGAQSMDAPVRLEFTTPDETAPVVTEVRQSGYGTDTAEVTFTINEAPSTLYWAVVEESKTTLIPDDFDPASQKWQITVAAGEKAGFRVAGATPAEGANLQTIIQEAAFKNRLDPQYGHTFKFYYVAMDAAGNYSAVGMILIRTLDNDPPHAWLEFYPSAVNNTPRANSDIMIVFDEQVKGGSETEQTFLELYEAVEKATTEVEKNAAKGTLVAQLTRYIQLWYIPTGSESPRQIKETGGDGNWINFENATIRMNKGNLVITLPGEDRPEDGAVKAINLDSGASYQFRLMGVFDTSFDANGVAVDTNDRITCVPEGGIGTDDGIGYLPFTTRYAQVEMSNGGEDVITIPTGGTDDEGNPETRSVRLDMIVKMVPLSTRNVVATDVWDMIMWSNTTVQVDIYRMVTDKNGVTTEPWALVREGLVVVGNDAGSSLTGNESRLARTTVQKGLDQEHEYYYGVHITHLGDEESPENNGPAAEPTAWSALVTMEFSLVAGTPNNVRDLANYPGDYKEFVQNKKVSEIGDAPVGTAPTTDRGTILTLEKRFRDTQVPNFYKDYPTFEAGSSDITMTVSLDRKGKLYWVASPAGSTRTTMTGANGATLTITPENDGGEDTVTQPNRNRKTYIPVDGEDREKNKNLIQFMTGGADDGPGKYERPTVQQVRSGTPLATNATIKYSNPPVEINSDLEVKEIPITGLIADQEYYIYIVLESDSGAPNDSADDQRIVQIYRVKTEPAEPPIIRITSNYTEATMTPNDIVNLDYVLVPSTALPDWAEDKEYYWCENFEEKASGNKDHKPTDACGGEAHTALWAMINRPDGIDGQTSFTLYADTTLKRTVVKYLTDSGKNSAQGVRAFGDKKSWPADTGYYENFEQYLRPDDDVKDDQGNANSYVLLVVAINDSVPTDTENYGFAAADGLMYQMLEPPTFSVANGKYIDVSASLSAYEKEGNKPAPDWGTRRSDVQNKTIVFNGAVTISFTNPIYLVMPNVRQAILTHDPTAAGHPTTHTDGSGISIMDLIDYDYVDGNDKPLTLTSSANLNGAQRSFTFRFTGIPSGFQIRIFPNGNVGGANPAGNYWPYMVTLAFEPLASEAAVTGQTAVLPEDELMAYGGFRVTWTPAGS